MYGMVEAVYYLTLLGMLLEQGAALQQIFQDKIAEGV